MEGVESFGELRVVEGADWNREIVTVNRDTEEPVLQSIIDKIRQESGFAAEDLLDRLVDLSLLREVKAKLRNRDLGTIEIDIERESIA